MGKGTIVSGGTDGLYTVDFDYGSTRVDQLISYFETLIADLETAILDAESAESTASIALAAAQSALNAKIVSYRDDESSENKNAVEVATETVAERSVLKEKARIKIATLRYQKMALESRLASLEKIDTAERADVWCVDLTEDGSGQVGTIEVNGEGPAKMLVPGCAAPETSDGLMTARGAQTPEQLFLNAAILPGWQKFSPTYRTGAISNIDYDNDTCTVTLDAAASTAQSLNINQATVLNDVDVQYMSCNSAAFDDGDKVVVKFVGQSWASPRVIGFVSNPKPCGSAYLMFYLEPSEVFAVSGTGVIEGQRAPQSDSTVTTIAHGNVVTVSEYEYVARIQSASMSASTDPVIHHQKHRIRWDVSCVKDRVEDSAFEFAGAQTVAGYTTHVDLIPTTSTDSEFYAPWCFEATYDFQVSATDYGFWTSFPAWVSIDDEYPLVYGTLTSSYYSAAVNWQESHRVARSNWLKEKLDPPASIQVEVNGKLLTYIFDSIGSPPATVRDDGDGPYSIVQVPVDEITIPVVSPPSGGGPTVGGYTEGVKNSTYEINFYDGFNPPNVIFYRREGVPVMSLR